MKLIKRALFAALAAAFALTAAASASELDIAPINMPITSPITSPITASGRLPDNILVYGTVAEIGENYLRLENTAENAEFPEIVIHIGEQTRVLDAAEAMPYNIENLETGDPVYAYVNSFMTMSLPPQAGAQLILCNPPQDMILPAYHTVLVSEMSDDGLSVTFLTDKGEIFTFDETVALTPYLTRNMVYMTNILPGVKMLVWSAAPRGEQPAPSKAMLFAYEYDGYIEIKEDGLYVSGEKLELGTAPILKDEYSILLPLRAVCEGLGWTVEWSVSERSATVSRDGASFVVTPGYESADEGEAVMMVVPEIIGGLTMVSVWDMARLLGMYYAG